LIGGIRQSASVDRKASATDALCEPITQTLEVSDHLIDPFRPSRRKARPVPAGGTAIAGKLGEFRTDFLKTQPDPLRKHNKRNPSQDWPGIAAMPGACSY
jgi:hypothetical protein